VTTGHELFREAILTSLEERERTDLLPAALHLREHEVAEFQRVMIDWVARYLEPRSVVREERRRGWL
jgi:hypothetical protein